MQNSASAIAPLLLRNLLTSIFIHAYNSLLYLSQKHKLLKLVNTSLVSTFLFFLSLFPSFLSSLNPSHHESRNYPSSPNSTKKDDNYNPGNNSGVARAMSQLLQIMSDIPVSSRKYELVRSLVENLLNDNNDVDHRVLREVNSNVLSSAFDKSLIQLEAAMVYPAARAGEVVSGGHESDYNNNNYYFYNIFKYCGRAMWRYAKSWEEVGRCGGGSADKVAAEVLWLGEKMAAAGCGEEAVCRWAEAGKLARLGLTAEPRVQGHLVKVSALLIKQAKEMGKEEEHEKTITPSEQQHTRQTKMQMLISWLPLLCSFTNGTDTPILNTNERAELEMILEEIISTLDEDSHEQERVLSLWLHHFTHCPASDWPNLRPCYTRWLGASRAKLLLLDS